MNNKNIVRYKTFVALLLIQTACTTTNHILLSERTFPPIPEDQCKVKVFTEKPKDKKFIEVAIISSSGDTMSDSRDLKRNITDEACSLGANAVVIGNFTTENSVGAISPGTGGSLQVLAIRLND